MDDAPDTADLDLTAVATRDELAELLRTVHLRADRPSLRALEAKTRHDAIRLSKTAVAEMLNGTRFPRKAIMVAFLRACGVQEEQLEPWRHAWDRVAAGEQESGWRESTHITAAGQTQHAAEPAWPHEPVAQVAGDESHTPGSVVDHSAQETSVAAEMQQLRAQITQLTTDNDRLRLQLADAHRQVDGTPSMWRFPDGSRITLVCSHRASDTRPPSDDPRNLNYVRFADLADLDTLIDIYGAVRAYNPTSRVVITAAQDLTHRDVSNHLVLIGGLAWKAVTPWFARILPIPIEPGDPADREAIVVREPDGGELEFKYTLADDKLVEDVGFFVRGENPSAPRRTLTICGGITTRGVRGAALCFIDWEMRERNSEWLVPRFPDGSTYCIVMRVPVVNNDPLAPDLSKSENRLFEWCDANS